ncbi:aldehyde dehydrogenase family protein [Mycobacterium interjectum]|uniref:aldehyde dehydrogenase family protein n=1 Tax=Mycobacterium interjectum TaxID=33895 RepID=UPI0008364CAD|nr:aldehyde dehydrogenase family protein [Mycobacterium interjectum]MCV7089186.1 aldehyde dehydrogenase family protein [Mycobacterium interjectum]
MVNHESRMLIDGKLVESETGRQFDNINPATEEILGATSDGTRADMGRAIAAARHAFDNTEWSRDGDARAAGLRQLQAALEAEREDLRSELVAEVGCPVLSTYGPQLDVPLREALTWPADMIGEFVWKRSLPDKDAFGMGSLTTREVWKEPIGVVGVITPWNFPFEIILNKIGPVLAMGNTCVLKPAPDTPWNATRIGRLIAENTDIPPGVINIVPSSDHLVGEAISMSPLIDMVAFTGSTATGSRIMAAAAETVKPTFLELGGKSVYLVLDEEGDIGGAVGGSAFICMHAGQGCAMPTRLLVPNSRYDEAVEIVKTAMEKNKYGDPTDPSVLQGPLISKKQQDRVLGYIDQGKQEGARLVTGGGIPKHLPKGYFVEPTVFANVNNKMTIAQEEIFGPVLSVIGFDGDDDAVRIANESIYGLSGVVFAHDLDRAKSVARRIRTGTMGINGGLWYGADAPFGGYKQSGVGRQCGIEGLEIFTETKTVGWPAQ